MELKERISIEIPVIAMTRPRTCGKCGQIMKGRMFNGYTDYFVCNNCLAKEETIEEYKCRSKT